VTSALRTRAWYVRRREGRWVYRIEADAAGVARGTSGRSAREKRGT
jgi:hypothetical protein